MPSDAAKTAFALAGLGGFNAHGAGFLVAAKECNVVPDLVTATSGQIVVLAAWLQNENLEQLLVDPDLAHNPTAQLAIALQGDPGIFRPAYVEALRRFFTPPARHDSPLETLLNRLFPAQLYKPTRPRSDFAKIADAFNASKIGIVFNAYNRKTGQSVLYGNEPARPLWDPQRAIPSATTSVDDRRGPGPNEPTLRLIDAKAVESALWLSLYGFEHLPQPDLIDGAYERSCIVSELHNFDRVFVARPLAQGWRDEPPPRNWFEVQDWQTEMWFSARYKAEVDALNQISGLVRSGALSHPYTIVELIEIAPKTPAGFFNYFIEREAVYKCAYEQAKSKFTALGLCPAAADAKPAHSPAPEHRSR